MTGGQTRRWNLAYIGRWENDDANREDGVVCLLIGKKGV